MIIFIDARTLGLSGIGILPSVLIITIGRLLSVRLCDLTGLIKIRNRHEINVNCGIKRIRMFSKNANYMPITYEY
jgi:uncharacterized membrane protein YdcZ (DUF606 family)